jgi:hypothetical protein
MHPMVLLGDEAQVDARFGPFGDSANLGARLVHGFMLNIPQAQKSFWTHTIDHLGDVFMWNLILVCLETVLVSVQDRCTVCANHSIALEIVLTAPDGTPW